MKCRRSILFFCSIVFASTTIHSQNVQVISQTDEIKASIDTLRKHDRQIIETSDAFKISFDSLTLSFLEEQAKSAALAKPQITKPSDKELVLLRLPMPGSDEIRLMYDRMMIVKNQYGIVCHPDHSSISQNVLNWQIRSLNGLLIIVGKGTFRLINLKDDIHVIVKYAHKEEVRD